MARSRDIEYKVGFTGDTSLLEAAVRKATSALESLGTKPKNLLQGLEQSAKAALELSNHLHNAYNADTGKLDLIQFRQSLEKSGMSIEKYATHLRNLGPEGELAFMQVATAIGAAELPLKRTNVLFDKLWISMKNTARWRLTTGALNAFVGGLLSAFGYAKSLDASLNDIRIVTGKSAEDMAKFATEANKAAKALSTTTTTYTDASLIYYQLGLSDLEVKGRTDTTVKMANVTGLSAETISQLMTAIWNNFYDGTESLESYADSMVALGAATATSSKEIAEGLEKFAPVALTVGLSFDYATAALTTITATTRESASVAGTALKTLFSRLEGLKLGETLEDGTDFNKYSKALLAVGVNIKDANGNLKDMDTILDELGAKWQTLAKDEQMALAETVAGVRQYTQLVALMNNWEFFKENLATSRGSAGALLELANIYAESWEAARNRVKAATENIYDSLINPELFIGLDKAFTPLLNVIASIVDAFGGLTGILPAAVLLMNTLYGDKIALSMRDMVTNIGLMTGAEQERTRALLAAFAAEVLKLSINDLDDTALATKTAILKDLVNLLIEINEKSDQLSAALLTHIQNASRLVELYKQLALALAETLEKALQAARDARGDMYGALTMPTGQTALGNDRTKFAFYNMKDAYIKNMSNELQLVFSNFTLKNFDLKTVFNQIDSGFAQIMERSAKLSTLKTSLGEVDLESLKWKDHVIELANALGLVRNAGESDTEYFNRLRVAVADTGAETLKTEDDIKQLQNMLRELGADDSMIINYTARMRDLARLAEKNNWTTELWKLAIAGIREEINNLPDMTDWADVLVQVGSSLSQMAMGMRSIDNLGRIFSDDSLDTGEKLVLLLTTIGMLLPLVGASIKSFGAISQAGGIAAAFGFKSAAAGAMTLGTAIKTALPILAAIGVAIYTLIKIIGSFITTEKEAAEALKTSSKAYQEEVKKLQDLQTELDNTTEKIRELLELANNGEISITQREELENLKKLNAELERLIALLEKAQKGALASRVGEIRKNGIKGTKLTDNTGVYGSEAAKSAFDDETLYLYYSKNYRNIADLGELASWINNLRNEIAGGTFKTAEDLHDFILRDLEYFKEEFDLTDDVFNAAVAVANELETAGAKAIGTAHDEWVSENLENYNTKESNYQDLLSAIDLGILKETDAGFIKILQDLIETRKLIYGSDYGETFLDPVILQLSQDDLGKILSGQISSLSKAGKDLLRNNAVIAKDIAEQYLQVYNEAQALLSKFGLGGSVDKLNYQELTLVAKMSGDPAYDDFQAFYTALKNENGVIPVSLRVEAIKDASTDMLSFLASGLILDPEKKADAELLSLLLEAYGELADLVDFADWSVQRLIDFLTSNNIDGLILILEQKIQDLQTKQGLIDEDIENTKQELKDLEELESEGIRVGAEEKKSVKSKLNLQENLKIATEIDLSDAEKDLEKLKEKIEKDPWEIQVKIDSGNEIAAELNNVKAAIKLINEDLSVDAENIVELGKRYPEALIDAEYDAAQNILRINEEKYQALKTLADGDLDGKRDNAVTELLNAGETAQALLTLATETEEGKRAAAKETLSLVSDNELSKVNIAGLAAMQTLIAVVLSEILKRQEELDTMINSLTASKAMTDTASLNAGIMASNYANAASAILRAFDEAFREISRGSAIIVDPTSVYSGIKTSVSANASFRSGTVGGFAEAKAAAMESPEYLKISGELNWLQGFSDILTKYLNGEMTWENVQNYFNAMSNFNEGAISGLTQGITDLLAGGDFLNNGDAAVAAIESLIKDPALKDMVAGNLEKIQTEINETIAKLLGSESTYKDRGKGSGGGGSSKKAKDEIDDDKKKIERYHEITREIERQQRLLSNIEKQLERTYGTKRFSLYKKLLETLTHEIEAQLEKLRLAQEYLKVDRQALLDMGLNLNVDESTGEILNYTLLLEDARAAYMAAVVAYNNYITAAGEAFDEATEEMLKNATEEAKKRWEKIEEALKQYEETLDLTRTLQDNIDDNRRKEEDIKLQEITYKMKLVIDIRDARKAINDFSREIEESFGDALTHGIKAAFFDEQNAREEIAMYQHYVDEYEALKQRLAEANEYTDTDAIVEELKNLESNIIESGEALLEWLEKVENMYVEALEAAAARFEHFTNLLSHNTEVLGTIKELYLLQGVTYKTEEGFNRLQNASLGQYQGYLRQAQLNKKWYDETAARLAEAEEKLANANETDVQYDALKKNRDALLDEANKALKAMLENSKAAMEIAKQMYLDQIERMSYEVEQKLTNGMGFDLMQDKYDHMMEESDRYLDTVEESLETSLWYAKLEGDIEKTTNKAYQLRLRALEEEIELRRENNTLSQYDLDILEAKYEVLKAQAELEDLLNNKNKLRLVRDSNGNWNYQYTANLADVEQKEQDLLKAKQNEYEITKKLVQDLEAELMKLPQEATKAVEQVYRDMAEGILSEEEGLARLAELERYYTTKATYLQNELERARSDMAEAATTSEILAAGLTESVYETSSDLIKNLVDVFKREGGEQLLTVASTTFGNLKEALIPHLEAFKDATDDVKKLLLGILTAENSSDGKSFKELYDNLSGEGKNQLIEALNSWGKPFRVIGGEIGSFINGIIHGDENSLDGLHEAIGNTGTDLWGLLINNSDSILKAADGLSGGFARDIGHMVDNITQEFVPTITEWIPKMGDAFDDFRRKIEETADAIGVDPDSLDDMVQEITDDIEDLYDEGQDAIDMMSKLLDAIYELQEAYLEWADAIMEVIRKLEKLARQQVVPTIEDVGGGGDDDGTDSDYKPYDTTTDWSLEMAKAARAGDWGAVNTYAGYRERKINELGLDPAMSTSELLSILDRAYRQMEEEIRKLIELVLSGGLFFDDLVGMDAGGYTGTWGNTDGRLALLHQKELVLNADDTEKILEAVHIMRGISDTVFRGIADQLDSAGAASMALLGSRLGSIEAPSASSSLELHITIEQVNFPGVTSSREIEEAFESLVNDAAQWARRRKS